MRIYLTEYFMDKFKTKKRVDVEASFRMEQIGFLRVFDSIPGDILLEFMTDEVSHMHEILNIVERMKKDREELQEKFRELKRPIEFPQPPEEPHQQKFRFYPELQMKLWAA